MTYKEIQRYVFRELGVQPSSVKTCWIAEVKREFGRTQGGGAKCRQRPRRSTVPVSLP